MSRLPTEHEKGSFVSRAIELSREGFSRGHGAPFGAVIVKDGQIIGKTGRCVFLHNIQVAVRLISQTQDYFLADDINI